jgi:sugar lactone lactonase YvrE
MAAEEAPAPGLAAEAVLTDGDDLGEGPVWDAEQGVLWRVDIKSGARLGWSPADGSQTAESFDGLLAFAVPRVGGGIIAGLDRSLVLVDPGGAQRVLAEVEDELPDNRFNDAKCDPRGRLWAGTMSMTRAPGTASLYRLEPGGSPEPVLDGLTISNGLGWSPDARLMYLIDSTTQRIDAFDYDLDRGAISGRRPFAEIDPEDGLPDGLAVDAEGGVWVALFGGGEVRRYRPDGSLDVRVPIPTSNCTCPAFGGPGLGELYLTSAKHKLSPAQLAAQPLAGALFRIRPGIAGLAASRFAG